MYNFIPVCPICFANMEINKIDDNGNLVYMCPECWYEETKTYNPTKHGAVVAIRIFNAEDGYTPMAELVFAFGGSDTIHWDNICEREKYIMGINAYTLYYDERPKRDFNDWRQSKCQ